MIKNLHEFCRYFYATTFIPVSLHHAGRPALSFPDNLAEFYSDDARGISDIRFSQNPDYYISASHAYLGYVQIADSEDFLIIGPVFSTPLSNDTLHTFVQEFFIAPDKRAEFTQLLSVFPQISLSHFLNTLSYLHLCLNDELKNIWEQLVTSPRITSSDLDNRHREQVLKAKEEQTFHNTYLYERELFSYVQMGDEHGLKNFAAQTSFGLVEGITAPNPLRQMKNIFIATTTQATRAAVAGGLDAEQAYQLSDVYIQECESMQDVNAISQLQYAMLMDFTARVAHSKIPQGMSPEIFQCVQFITCHTADTIGIEDVVAHVGRSRSYLTKKFKKELGFEMGGFIMRCKLEEAKSLLTCSGKSLSEISNYLCFSSQAYFQTVFKKKYGLTPLQYRNQTRKNV